MIHQRTKLKGIRFRTDIQKWEARIQINKIEHIRYFTEPTDAAAWRESLKDQKSSSCFLTFNDICPKWLESIENDPSYSRQTCFRYTGDARVHLKPFFELRKIQDISETDVLSFAVHLKEKRYRGKCLSPKTIKNIVGVLSNFFEYCWARGYIVLNPVGSSLFRQNLKRIVKERRNFEQSIRIRARSAEDLILLLNFAHQKDVQFGMITKTILSAALRLGEAASLTYGDIVRTTDPISKIVTVFITINKTRDHRTHEVQMNAKCGSNGLVPISSELFDELAHWRIQAENLGFSTQKNDPIFPDLATNQMRYSDALASLSEKIGIERTTAHCLRHSALTYLAAQDWSMQQLQKFARHRSLNMTRAYIAVSHIHTEGMTRTMETLTSRARPT